jgi:type IV fimbrial biogenesis protein FimT
MSQVDSQGFRPRKERVVKQTSGFSVIELMVTVSILAILVALATPSFRNFTSSTRVTTANNDLVTALNLARSESTRRSVPVTVCASADGTTCGDNTNWASGWIVFQNPGAPGVIANSTTDVLQKWGSVPGIVQVATGAAYVQYQPTGMLNAAATIAVDVSYPGCTGKLQLRHIEISVVGTINTQLRQCP